MTSLPRAGTRLGYRARAAAIAAGLALLGFLGASAQAGASPSAGAATFSLSTIGGGGSLLLHGHPGQTLQAGVVVANLTTHPITLRVQPSDIVTAGNGNAAYVTSGLTGAGRWMRLPKETVALGPRARARLPFTITVPRWATSASHYAGIVAFDTHDLRTAERTQRTRGRSFTFIRLVREAVPVTIRLPGPLRRHLTLTATTLAVRPSGAALMLDLHAEGTELIESAKVHVSVTRDKDTVFTSSTSLGQLFPATSLSDAIPWSGTPIPGTYHVIGTIQPQAAAPIHVDQIITVSKGTAHRLRALSPHQAANAPTRSYVPSWVYAVLLLAGVSLAACVVVVWRVRRAAV